MNHNHIIHLCKLCGVIVGQGRRMSEHTTIVSDMTCEDCNLEMEVNKEVLGEPIEESFLPEDNCNNEQTIEDLKSYISLMDKKYLRLYDKHLALHKRLQDGIERTVEAYDSLGNRCFEEILMILMNKDNEYVLNAMISFRAMKDWQNEKQ